MAHPSAPQAVSLRRAVELALDASRGLAYMHSKKPSPIVHRDLKPANLMIAGNLYQVRVSSQVSPAASRAISGRRLQPSPQLRKKRQCI